MFDIILHRIKKAKFSSVSLDGTSDAGHVDQLTIVFRYLEYDTPRERFVKFSANQGHKAIDMFTGVKDFLFTNGLDIMDCRGQSYDNASAMTGKFNGLQALVKSKNKLAIWVPCTTHSLNLVGEKASDASFASIDYFSLL